MRNLTDDEKKNIAKVIGEDLVNTHGKRKYYSQKQIHTSLQRRHYDIDVHCWAYCLCMDHGAFDTYHHSIGEVCNYLGMKGSMLSAATDHASDSWFDFDFDRSWLELPDFDFSNLLDFLDS